MLSQADLDFLIALVHERSGINLGRDKAYLLEGRLTPILRPLGLSGIGELAGALRRSRNEALVRAVIESMTTHESSFFRDAGVFEHLAARVLPALGRQRRSSRRLRCWSAACAFGQEPTSLAILLAEQAADFPGWAIEIVASDLSGVALDRCRRAVYSSFEIERGLSEERRRRWFQPDDKGWRLSAELARKIQYNKINLLNDDPTLGTFDLILLRNVLIYFDRPTRQRVLSMIRRRLADDGFLVLGSTEDPSDLGLDLESGGWRGFYQPMAPTSCSMVASL
ncbi:chemotaxis protein methyltransferase CheR [Arboricoccus pini]|uniref:protein-glutamate O-methyltransferase n=1 Tax=Arboricoccus pini TaxID=1963835 RepID=A0A212RU92_9PROT|nr:protein-glutamate O-methyltransferase CheR [Arboricoccus pini]SNB76117.1 chemotaxis protein methyltransferase CheR [Arboricoccus pini]